MIETDKATETERREDRVRDMREDERYERDKKRETKRLRDWWASERAERTDLPECAMPLSNISVRNATPALTMLVSFSHSHATFLSLDGLPTQHTFEAN